MLVVLVVLGVGAAVMLDHLPGANPTDGLSRSAPTTGVSPTSPGGTGSAGVDPTAIQAATVAACRATYVAAEGAVAAYQVLHRRLPDQAGLAAAADGALHTRWYAVVVDPSAPDGLGVALPGGPVSAGDAACARAG